jgi:hypothetical protein
MLLLEEMLLANLCSRLVVTRTPWISNSQAHDLHRDVLRDLSRAFPDACTPISLQTVHDDAG